MAMELSFLIFLGFLKSCYPQQSSIDIDGIFHEINIYKPTILWDSPMETSILWVKSLGTPIIMDGSY